MSTLSQFFSSNNVSTNFIRATAVSSLPGIASTNIDYQPYKDSESNYLQLTPFNSSYTFPSYDCCPRKYAYEGGFLICSASNVAWIVAPSSSQVSRSWFARNDANTTAQQVSGCTGWFVPTITQLQNPGYTCRKFWDAFASGGVFRYWSSSEFNSIQAWSLTNGGVACNFNHNSKNACHFGVRAFRCVTY
jgi:hypothetical protein